MKQRVNYQVLLLKNKLRIYLTTTIDTMKSPIYTSNNDKGSTTGITVYPSVEIRLIKFIEDDTGRRIPKPWDIQDVVSLDKRDIAIFVNEFKQMMDKMKTPDLYVYTGNRLELNEKIAAKNRQVFKAWTSTVELSAVVVIDEDDKRVEGIKMKFMNEDHSVLLTLNDMESLYYNLSRLDIDTLCLLMYLNFMNNPSGRTSFTPETLKSDILPL